MYILSYIVHYMFYRYTLLLSLHTLQSWCPFIIVKNTCAGKRMGRHINIKHQNQTSFINILNL